VRKCDAHMSVNYANMCVNYNAKYMDYTNISVNDANMPVNYNAIYI
jgi:hypothetical protein